MHTCMQDQDTLAKRNDFFDNGVITVQKIIINAQTVGRETNSVNLLTKELLP